MSKREQEKKEQKKLPCFFTDTYSNKLQLLKSLWEVQNWSDLVVRHASGECWWARHEDSNLFNRHCACHQIPLRLHCDTRNI